MDSITIQQPFDSTFTYLSSPTFKDDWKAHQKLGGIVKPYVRIKRKGPQEAKMYFALSRMVSDSKRMLFIITGDDSETTIAHKHRSQVFFVIFAMLGLVAFIIPGLLMFFVIWLRRKNRTKWSQLLFEYMEEWAKS